MISRIITKFGVAKIIPSSDGYKRYLITSRKEGNKGKLLHRLIWEDFYDTKIPEGYLIHHRNFNSLDNCILNLQLMRIEDHAKLHKSGENNYRYRSNINTDDIVHEYFDNGLSTLNIAEIYGISQTMVYKRLKSTGRQLRDCSGENHPRYRDDIDTDVIEYEYFVNGLSMREIGDKYGISPNTCYGRLRRKYK